MNFLKLLFEDGEEGVYYDKYDLGDDNKKQSSEDYIKSKIKDFVNSSDFKTTEEPDEVEINLDGVTKKVSKAEYAQIRSMQVSGNRIGKAIDDYIKENKNKDFKNRAEYFNNLRELTHFDDVVTFSIIDKETGKEKKVTDFRPQFKGRSIKDFVESKEKLAEKGKADPVFSINEVSNNMYTDDKFFMQVLYLLYSKGIISGSLVLNKNGQLEEIFKGLKEKKDFFGDIVPSIISKNALKKTLDYFPKQKKAIIKKINTQLSKNYTWGENAKKFITKEGTDITLRNKQEYNDANERLKEVNRLIQDFTRKIESRPRTKADKTLEELRAELKSKMAKGSQVERLKEYLQLNTEEFKEKVERENLSGLNWLKANLEATVNTYLNNIVSVGNGAKKYDDVKASLKSTEEELNNPEEFLKKVAPLDDKDLNALIKEYERVDDLETYCNKTHTKEEVQKAKATLENFNNIKNPTQQDYEDLNAAGVIYNKFIEESSKDAEEANRKRIDFSKNKGNLSVPKFIEKLKTAFMENTGRGIFDHTTKFLNYIFFGKAVAEKEKTAMEKYLLNKPEREKREAAEAEAKRQKNAKTAEKINKQFLENINKLYNIYSNGIAEKNEIVKKMQDNLKQKQDELTKIKPIDTTKKASLKKEINDLKDKIKKEALEASYSLRLLSAIMNTNEISDITAASNIFSDKSRENAIKRSDAKNYQKIIDDAMKQIEQDEEDD